MRTRDHSHSMSRSTSVLTPSGRGGVGGSVGRSISGGGSAAGGGGGDTGADAGDAGTGGGDRVIYDVDAVHAQYSAELFAGLFITNAPTLST